ncbi:MAG: dihydrodipicolinate synthase family protein [Solirubrobacterales bacterium]
MKPVLLAAVVTPMRDGGEAVDEEAIKPLVDYLEDGGCDGLFIAGTAGEGLLLGHDERKRVAELFCGAARGRRLVHVGSQTTAATVDLARHAAELGADGVAVIPPPYYPLPEEALIAHLVAAGQACAPTPFFIYAFASRSGYPLTPEVVEAVAERLDNLKGMKVSEPTLELAAPFLGLGLEILIGADPIVPAALTAGAAGAASALAGALPREVRAIIDDPGPNAAQELTDLRSDIIVDGDLIPSIKAELGRRGLPVRADVRRPLRAVGHDRAGLA